MGLQADSSPSESVLVVMNANRNKGSMDALEWALKHVVRRRDTVIVLGVIYEFGEKSSCFPVNFGISISGIWERLEFSSQGQEARPRELGEEIERKREQYQNNIQPFYRQCKKNEVNLEVKLAFGFCPEKITVEQAQNSNPRWIILDSHLKKYRLFIYGQVGCNIAVMKGKVATWTPSKAAPSENPPGKCKRIDNDGLMTRRSVAGNQIDLVDIRERGSPCAPPQPSQSPSWYPLSWRSGFPRAFTQAELEAMTNGFSEENVTAYDICGIKIYEGLFQETPVVVTSFSENDERFWTTLKILSTVRHRSIMNLVGYCCTGTSMFLLCDYPCMGTLGMSLQCDDSAKNLPWKARWYIALEIGGCLRYLHEECVDGAIVHLSVCSANVVLSHGCSAMLGNFLTARWLKDDSPSNDRWGNLKEDERLAIDVCDYGMLLMELITGKSAKVFQTQSEGQTLIEWALPFLASGRVKEVVDPRVKDNCENRVVYQMVNAALLCLRNDSARRFSISEVLAVVRGDQLAVTQC